MAYYAGAVAALASLIYAIAVSYAAVTKIGLNVLFTYHPLGASAFLVFAVLGIISSQRAQFGSHKARITTHGYYQMAATACALATNTVIYMNKEAKGKPHLTTWHGLLGAATTGLWLMLQVSGGLSWYQPRIISAVMPLNKAYIQHGLFGTVAFTVLLATHSMALAGSYQGYVKGTAGWWGLVLCLALLGGAVLQGTGKIFTRAKRAFGLGGGGLKDKKKAATAKAQ